MKIRWPVIVEDPKCQRPSGLHLHKHVHVRVFTHTHTPTTILFIVRIPSTMLFPSIWTYHCTPLDRIGLRLSVFLILLWSLEQPSLKLDDQALRMWQKEDFKKRNTNFHCLESQFPLSVSNVCSILMDQLCWLISKLSDMGFRVRTAEPVRVHLEWDSKMVSSLDPLALRLWSLEVEGTVPFHAAVLLLVWP